MSVWQPLRAPDVPETPGSRPFQLSKRKPRKIGSVMCLGRTGTAWGAFAGEGGVVGGRGWGTGRLGSSIPQRDCDSMPI